MLELRMFLWILSLGFTIGSMFVSDARSRYTLSMAVLMLVILEIVDGIR